MSTKLQKKIDAEATREVAVAVEPLAVGIIDNAVHDAASHTESRDSGYTSSGNAEAAMEPVAAAVPDSLHALDSSPVNSKIVVTDAGPILATPDFETLLPKGDPAHRLPVGARIIKRAEGIFQSIQLSPAIDHPVLVTATAIAAIAQFVPHFHED